MNAWSNIEISSQDAEMIEIDKLQKTLGQLPANVEQIRELITRFEACHFKYKQHFNHIKTSILSLQPTTDLGQIGTHHIHKGENAWKNDKTGRSLSGQQYLWALNHWLGDDFHTEIPANHSGQDKDEWTKVWLVASLAKTLKEQLVPKL